MTIFIQATLFGRIFYLEFMNETVTNIINAYFKKLLQGDNRPPVDTENC